jgi:hypothetical protein
MLPGDLLWTRSESAVGALIRFGARVRYHGWLAALRCSGYPTGPDDIAWGNHIAVVADGCLIEALADGLTRSPLDKYPASAYRLLPLASVAPGVTDAARARASAFAEAELARRDGYSWLGIASIVLSLVTPARLDLSWDGTMICSTFGARVWEHAGVALPTLSPYTTMPADLAFMVL